MARTLSPQRDRVTYPRPHQVGPVERRLAEKMRRTPGGAHQHMLVVRRDAQLIVEACLAAGQPERALWLLSPALSLIESLPVSCLDTAAVAEQEADGAEDVAWEQYRAAGQTVEAWTLYERRAHRMLAATYAKLAAGRAKHGRNV